MGHVWWLRVRGGAWWQWRWLVRWYSLHGSLALSVEIDLRWSATHPVCIDTVRDFPLRANAHTNARTHTHTHMHTHMHTHTHVFLLLSDLRRRCRIPCAQEAKTATQKP